MTVNIQRARELLRSFPLDDIFAALAFNAVEDASAMMTDMMKDPTFIATDGLPTKQRMIDCATTFAVETYPIQVDEAGELLDTDAIMPPHVPPFEWVMREIIKQLYEQNPELMTLEYHPS